MITLGGNIKLEGFEELEHAMLIVVKKMVCIFAKKVSQGLGEIESFEVTKKGREVTVTAKTKVKEIEESSKADNLFVALSNALKAVEEKSK